ncbi:acyltransferase family protein [Goekera deserti]|uniref:Acyltransferase n=1 Tax=Goekera deserti TaxID=2497753 RepID=A0A7K3WEV1_9ACTN|nr:acyltransferase [Goekera deserti]NDI48600.1 acyltransferase family protein [Goekera deserti]NEL55021.1 acyltransferase [Goekera deserti]
MTRTTPARPAVPGPRRAPGGAQSLESAFSPRSNSLAVLRLALAAVVALTHALANGYGWQPRLGGVEVGALAVDAFFVLSGMLVAGSLLRLGSTGRYLWHRALRILPGFWVCLVVTAAVLAPLAAALGGRAEGLDSGPGWRYVLVNAFLPILQGGIGDVHAGDTGAVLNGSLWTLQYEAACYVLLALLGLCSVLQRRRWVVPALALVLAVGTVADAAGLFDRVDLPLFAVEPALRFTLVFLLGVTAHLYARWVPVHWTLAALGMAVVAVASVLAPEQRSLAAPALAYVCVYAVVRLPLRWTPRWDLSYGLYIYHWPVQVVLVAAGLPALGAWLFVPLALVPALALAALSWVLVEGPALGWKGAGWVDGRVRRAPAGSAGGRAG